MWVKEKQRGLSLTPSQNIYLEPWISFPSSSNLIPITHEKSHLFLDRSSEVFVLIETENMPGVEEEDSLLVKHFLFYFLKNLYQFLQIEHFGELLAWEIDFHITFLLRSDIKHFSQLILASFLQERFFINDRLPLRRIQSVQVNGEPQPFELLRNYIEKDSFGRIYQKLNKIQWERHLEELKNFGKLANQVTQFESQKTENEVVCKPDLILFQQVEEASILKHGNEEIPLRNISLATSTTLLTSPDTNEIIYNSMKKESLCVSPLSSVQNSNDTQHELPSINKNDTYLPEICSQFECDLRKKSVEHVTFGEKKQKNQSTSNTRTYRETEVILDADQNKKPFDNCSKISSTACDGSRPTLKRTKKGGVIVPSKPPNILVYSVSKTITEDLIKTLQKILADDMYTVYPLSNKDLKTKIWFENNILLVLCGSIPNDISKHILEYFLKGGKMLCLCSDILHVVLPSFRMAEVCIILEKCCKYKIEFINF